MRRIVGILGALLFSGALAQAPAKAPRIGVLHNGNQASTAHLTEAFVRGLAELGYHDGRNVTLEYRYAEGRFDRLPALAQQLAAAGTGILFAPSALAELERVIGQLGKAFLAVEAKAPGELERAFADMTKWRADAVLVINLKAAKAIGVAFPRELMLRAEQVLE